MRRTSLVALAFCSVLPGSQALALPVICTWNSVVHLHPEQALVAPGNARVRFRNLSDSWRSLHANGTVVSLAPHGSRVLLLARGTSIYESRAAERHLLAVVRGSAKTQTVVLE